MKIHQFLVFVLMIVFAVSCKNEKAGPPVVTDQIVYTVKLKNPDTIPDTHHEYMDDSTRIHFLKNIIDPVLAGEVTGWVWTDKPRIATVEELKSRFAWDKSKPFPDTLDPINYRIDLNKITTIRYFEQWSMHRKTLQIEKKVLGIALILDSYDDQGNFRGTEPVLYVFYDKEFPLSLGK